MKCRFFKSEIVKPIETTSMLSNGLSTTVQRCPVCKVNLDSQRLPIVAVIALFLVVATCG